MNLRRNNAPSISLPRTVALSCLLTAILATFVFAAGTDCAMVTEQEIKLVWTGDYGQGEQVYLSSCEEGIWSPSVRLSDAAGHVFHAAVGSGDDGKVWAAWALQDGQKSYLEYTVFDTHEWKPPQRITVKTGNNTGVSLVVDRNNTPWLAWAGVGNTYTDIFWSRWNGQQWESPAKAHSENSVPDLNPQLFLDDNGEIILSWQTFAREEKKYVTVSQIWNGVQWHPAPAGTGENVNNKISSDHSLLPAIPDFVQDRRQAALFVRSKDGAGSAPLTAY